MKRFSTNTLLIQESEYRFVTALQEAEDNGWKPLWSTYKIIHKK